MTLKQKDRLLTIDTVIPNPEGEDESDNFLVIQMRGAEGISFPYAFDLALVGPKERRPDPARLIGSRVRIGIKRVLNDPDTSEFDHVFRHGVIETFTETGPLDAFRSYAVRVVPAFKLTAYETRCRSAPGSNPARRSSASCACRCPSPRRAPISPSSACANTSSPR
jgi:uncharacterized protein involved in type VI secretion and phage assembly